MNYCSMCGKKVVENAKYCVFCGGKIEKNNVIKKDSTGEEKNKFTEDGQKQIKKSSAKKKNSSKNTNQKKTTDKDFFEIEIPGISGTKIVRFTNFEIIYQDTTIKYKDLTGIACNQIYHSTNLIPTHQEFSFSFHSLNDSISLSFGTTLHIGSKSRKEVFYKLYSIAKEFLAPIILEKLIYQTVEQGETIQIGDVYFNKHGYYKKKLFGLGEEEWVHWTDNVGEPGMESGSINIYKAGDGKYKNFSSISLGVQNAIIIPDLIKAMYSIINNK